MEAGRGPYQLEAAGKVELALHHVKEDGDGGLSQLDLRHQGHLQDGTHHLRDEPYLVGTLERGCGRAVCGGGGGQEKQNETHQKMNQQLNTLTKHLYQI